MTLGPSKAHIPRSGHGLRWMKLRNPRLAPTHPLTVTYRIWRTDAGGHLCGVTVTVRDDNRQAAARAVRDARRRVWGWEDQAAKRVALARTRATEARTVARRALG